MSFTFTRPASPGAVANARRLAGATLVALALILCAAGSARAGSDNFCVTNVGSGGVCTGPSHSLTASWGSDNSNDGGQGCGGALNYGSYFCATVYGCHVYSGANVLTPAIKNPNGHTITMAGYESDGVTGAPAGCPHGSALAMVQGTAGSVPPALADMPVFQEPATAADAPPPAVQAIVRDTSVAGTREFATPDGPAWAAVDGSNGDLCLVASDGTDGYGVTCGAPGVVADRGLVGVFEGPGASTNGDAVVGVVPADTSVAVTGVAEAQRVRASSHGVVARELSAGARKLEVLRGHGAHRVRLRLALGK
jgi:hypothetical protein